MLADYFFYDMRDYPSLNMVSLMRRMPLSLTDQETIVAHECGRLDASTRSSTVCHGKTGIELSACQSFEGKHVVGPYYGSLAYADLERDCKLLQKKPQELRQDGKWLA